MIDCADLVGSVYDLVIEYLDLVSEFHSLDWKLGLSPSAANKSTLEGLL